MHILALSVTFCAIFSVGGAADILAIFPLPSYSHFVIGDVLTKELARRGHKVTVVTAFEPKATIKNCSYITLTGMKEFLDEDIAKNFNFFESQDTNKFVMTVVTRQFAYSLTKTFYEHENVQKLIKSKGTYDVIIMEHFLNEAIYGFCHLFKAHCIAVTAVGAMNWSNRLTGNIGLASYIPEMTTNFAPEMSFFERLENLALMVFEEILFHAHVLPKMDELMHQHLPNAPSVYNLYPNVSMVLLNSHPALSAPVPVTPNMIEVGGIHVEGLKDVKLPSDIQSFLDDHSEGVIYFALGSYAKSKDIPKEFLKEIIKALKQWGKPILWKYEEDLPERIDNVRVAKWFPQTAVLAHQNVVAFITHCGRLSTLESVYYGVPMIGLPLFAEQAHNAAEMVYYGYGIAIELKLLKAEGLYDALVEVTTNPRYTREVKLRSKAMRKRNALDEAIYWIEHVVEFDGASYLKSTAVQLPWYQLWMVDVIGLLVISFLGFSTLAIYFILRCCGRRPKAGQGSENVSKEKKKN